MTEVVCNYHLGKKVHVKYNTDDTIGDLKKLIEAQTGTHWNKIDPASTSPFLGHHYSLLRVL